MSSSNFVSILEESLVIKNSNADYWENSVFKNLVNQNNDYRGFWGEGIIHNFCRAAGLTSEWDEDSNINCEDGVYDIVVDGQRVEVKTSFSSKNWQHENIYLSGDKCDKVAFVDVDAENIYITILDQDLLSPAAYDLNYQILGKRPTLRNNQDDKWKFDFSKRTIRIGIEMGYTFVYNVENPDVEGLSEFLRSKLGRGV